MTLLPSFPVAPPILTLDPPLSSSGGPGSEKSGRVREVSALHPAWKVISVGGSLLRYLNQVYPEGAAERAEEGSSNGQAEAIRELFRKGDMVPQVSREGSL